VLILLLSLLLQEPRKADEKSIAARVNDEVVTWDEVDLRVTRGGQIKKEEVPPKVREAVLRQIVQERLFQMEAKRLNIVVTEQKIDDWVEKVKKNQIGRAHDTKEEVERKFSEYLLAKRVTLTEYREELRQELMGDSVRYRLLQDSVRNPTLYSSLLTDFVTPDEIRDYYTKNQERFKAILQITAMRVALQFNPAQAGDKELKMQLAESLLRKIEAGAAFDFIVRLYSDVKPDDKGYPGFRGATPESLKFSPETMTMLFHKLAEGKVSPITVDGNTVNIFRLEQKVDEPADSFDAAQTKIRAELENRKRTENRNALRGELLRRYYVQPANLFDTGDDRKNDRP
jgi:hypothetical protein